MSRRSRRGARRRRRRGDAGCEDQNAHDMRNALHPRQPRCLEFRIGPMREAVQRGGHEPHQIPVRMCGRILEFLVYAHPHTRHHADDEKDQTQTDENDVNVNAHTSLPLGATRPQMFPLLMTGDSAAHHPRNSRDMARKPRRRSGKERPDNYTSGLRLRRFRVTAHEGENNWR